MKRLFTSKEKELISGSWKKMGIGFSGIANILVYKPATIFTVWWYKAQSEKAISTAFNSS